MQDRHLIAAGAINMFIAVAAGAFGAHALKQSLSPEMLSIWHTAANYQMMHALGLIAIGLLMPRFNQVMLKRAGLTMLIGIIIFSGSLYALALSGIRIPRRNHAARWYGVFVGLGDAGMGSNPSQILN